MGGRQRGSSVRHMDLVYYEIEENELSSGGTRIMFAKSCCTQQEVAEGMITGGREERGKVWGKDFQTGEPMCNRLQGERAAKTSIK